MRIEFQDSAVPEPLGVGFPYIPGLPSELYQRELLDFVEITPETLCQEPIDKIAGSITLIPKQLETAVSTCGRLPIVVHGVELSIGSAHSWNDSYLNMLDEFQRFCPFLWHSEHLGFQTILGNDGTSLNVGVPLPLPATEEALHLVAERSAAIRRRYGVPFLLENPAHYLVDMPFDPEICDEIELMNRISDFGGCGILLDLHNLYCNAINHRFDAFDAVDRVNLDRVVEIHVAGGSWREGFWMDAHDSCVPERVWQLLEYTITRSPNVLGVVFEVLDQYAVRLGWKVIAHELTRAREIWLRCRCGIESISK